MKLSDDDLERALYCVAEVVDRRRRAGITVPHWMTELAKRFDLASLTSGMSPAGHESQGGSAPLDLVELVTTAEAAGMLGISARQVRRLGPDLGGEIIGGRMVYKRHAVIEYAKERANGRHRRSV